MKKKILYSFYDIIDRYHRLCYRPYRPHRDVRHCSLIRRSYRSKVRCQSPNYRNSRRTIL